LAAPVPESSGELENPPVARSPEASLVATQTLQLLDDLRVPYAVAPQGLPTPSWHQISADGRAEALHWYAGDGADAAGYTLGGTPIWGEVADDRLTAAYASGLGGEWRPDLPILDRGGRRHASVWRDAQGGTILPFDPDQLVANLRSERYRELTDGTGRAIRALSRRAYYAVRPAVPHRLQIAARRSFSRVQGRTRFPRWPIEPALHDLVAFVLGCIADAAGAPIPYIASGPAGHDWALVLTHDVETAEGRDAIARVRAVEEAAGYRSSWNLVPERYAVSDALVSDLQSGGNEVGVHGLRHDGRDLASIETLRERLPEMRRWAERWGAVGFRAPATHRRWEWMPRLGFDYDSSYPDSDPYEPMPGGCCSWLPFFNEDQVELPITLPQDHTLFVILRRDARLWREKADHLRGCGGMALLIVHPDYMLEDEPLAAYTEFLDVYRNDATAWKALPHEVSAWWRARAATSLCFIGGAWRATGPAARRAAVVFASPAR
jgi:hypothetical protein